MIMTLGQLLAGIKPAAKAIGAAIISADVITLGKVGVLVGSAMVTLYLAYKTYKQRKKVAQETEPDIMASFMAFGAERDNEERVEDVIRNVRKTVDKADKKRKKKGSKNKPNMYASQLREELRTFQNDLDMNEEFDTTHVWLNNFAFQ